MYLIVNKLNGYFEEGIRNKYLMLVPTNKSKKRVLWSKIRNLIKSITKNSDDYDEKYMKIKLTSYD